MPRIVSAAQLKLGFQNLFGPLGRPSIVTGHYTAGPVDSSDDHAIKLCRSYHAAHKAKGWGGEGYHYCITRRGTILCLRPIALKGAHTGKHNTSNVGVMMHGTTGDKPSQAQRESYWWLLHNAHTPKLPPAHRSPTSLANCARKGHNSWPGHESNGCPGAFKPMYLQGGIQSKSSGLQHLTRSEREHVLALRRLRAKKDPTAGQEEERKTHWHWLDKQRGRIFHAASEKPGGWDDQDRRARYRTLRSLTGRGAKI